jgi:hypothetical protein
MMRMTVLARDKEPGSRRPGRNALHRDRSRESGRKQQGLLPLRAIPEVAVAIPEVEAAVAQ